MAYNPFTRSRPTAPQQFGPTYLPRSNQQPFLGPVPQSGGPQLAMGLMGQGGGGGFNPAPNGPNPFGQAPVNQFGRSQGRQYGQAPSQNPFANPFSFTPPGYNPTNPHQATPSPFASAPINQFIPDRPTLQPGPTPLQRPDLPIPQEPTQPVMTPPDDGFMGNPMGPPISNGGVPVPLSNAFPAGTPAPISPQYYTNVVPGSPNSVGILPAPGSNMALGKNMEDPYGSTPNPFPVARPQGAVR